MGGRKQPSSLQGAVSFVSRIKMLYKRQGRKQATKLIYSSSCIMATPVLDKYFLKHIYSDRVTSFSVSSAFCINIHVVAESMTWIYTNMTAWKKGTCTTRVSSSSSSSWQGGSWWIGGREGGRPTDPSSWAMAGLHFGELQLELRSCKILLGEGGKHPCLLYYVFPPQLAVGALLERNHRLKALKL